MKLSIRPVRPSDLDRCAAIEEVCFPWEQAVSLEAIRERIADEMFGDTSFHNESCPWQSVFSLAVHPDWQGHGYGRDLLNALIEHSRREGRKGVALTCLERKLAYYESFSFKNRGVSKSSHGGAVWYDMVLPF